MILFFLIFLKSLRIFERDSDESYVLTHWGGGHNFQRAFLRKALHCGLEIIGRYLRLMIRMGRECS